MTRIPFRLTQAALVVGGLFGVHYVAQPASPLVPATDPLGTGSTSIKPNVMFILDNSGSMGRDTMPDYVDDSNNSTNATTASCYDAGDNTDGTGFGKIDGNTDACILGDPPYMSPDLNTIYYNPEIQYKPARAAGGLSDMNSQTSANTTGWTAVTNNAFDSSASLDNLVSGYPDRMWCLNKADVLLSPGVCETNNAYQYPDATLAFGEDSAGDPKYTGGAPYYYRIRTAQFCSDAARTASTCSSGSAINPTTQIYVAPEFCTDSELTNCAVGTDITAAHVFSGVRWCSDAGTLLNCQRKKIGSFIHPKHLGVVDPAGTTPDAKATGTLTVSSVHASDSSITNITIGGVTVVSNTAIAVTGGSATTTVAAQIAAALTSANYTASVTGSTVTYTAANFGTAPNGQVIALSSSQIGTTSAVGRVQMDTVNGGNTITSITVNGVQLLTCAPAVNPTKTGSSTNTTVEWQTGGGTSGAASRLVVQGTSTSSSSASGRKTNMRNALKAAIDTCRTSGTPPTVLYTTGTGGSTSPYVTLIAPISYGSTPNNAWAVVETGTASTTTCTMGSGGTCTAGAFSPQVAASVTPMAGGRSAGTGTVRKGYGQFSRTNIVPSNDSYPKSISRGDCLGATCTYEEEMTNFANWYAYYRTRMQMAKTGVGRAFADIDEAYRVGFIGICPTTSNNCQTSAMGATLDLAGKYLRIADFDSGQKLSWYNMLYGTVPSSFTPLREALARVGLIFAGKAGLVSTGLTKGMVAADDPVTSECQPNFAILSTDGYWNGNVGRQLDDATAVGDQDATNAGPYSLRSQGVYQGATASSNSLADVALYYYKTDLRPTLTDSVPITNKDSNNAQHMVTFTLGLGLDGEKTYRADYETANEGDFYNIKQGTADWPVAVGDSPSALDDLWHAAVNGRGVFFSARDPETLAASLTETLNQLQARVGAGAAAATSNLQPVAGDNFAFTAQYQTNDWIGDLKARTIDLGTGTVSAVTLWAAASQLDATLHTDRRIFTFDSGDTAGLSANRLKHFCVVADVGAPWCNDGGGLTAAEADGFDSSLIALPQEGLWPAPGIATSQMLVNYLRGDDSYVNTGTVPRTSTDLFRRRISVLGDIVNAQPAYVKKSPFNYSDAGFAGFQACTDGIGTGCSPDHFPDPTKARRGTVYAASNDGMLHAFETDVNDSPYYQTAGITTAVTSDDTFSCVPTTCNVNNGSERWAYIPGTLLPDLYVLANETYTHRYYTDGTPQVGDICLTTPCAGQNDWRTILVAGFNSGGKGYYALDVTNPLAPKALWEFTHTPGNCVVVTNPTSGARNGEKGVPTGGPFYGDCYLGLSFGNPIITKRKRDGKWVVVVTSGYNNVTPNTTVGGVDASLLQGKGFVYILDAATGEILNRLNTTNGSAASPAGLSKINAWATSASTDNTALAIYGGDLDGYMWRFDLDYGDVSVTTAPTNANYHSVTPVARAKDASGTFQPITVKPELGEYATKRIIMFGTGKFLETGDKNPPYNQQTIYALRDDAATVTNASYPATCNGVVVCNVRDSTAVKVRVLEAVSGNANQRTIAAGTAPTWSGTSFGWLIDLDSGERVNVDPQLQLGTLVVATNVPSTGTCTAGGFSWINFLDYATGSYIPGASANAASQKIGSSLTVGLNVVMLPGGKVVTIATTADNQQLTQDTPVPPGSFTGRRVSWRELIRDQ